MRIVVEMTGATGAVYGVGLLAALADLGVDGTSFLAAGLR